MNRPTRRFLYVILSCVWGVVLSVLPFTGVQAQQKITIVTEDYPPFFGSTLKNNGWSWDLVETALKRVNYEPTLEFLPWARAVEGTKTGLYDGLLGAFWTEERTEWSVFSVPFAEVRTGFFKHMDRSDITYTGNLQELTQFTIGSGRGYSYSPAFDSADFLNKVETTDTKQALQMLWRGRVDLVAGNELVDKFTMISELEMLPDYQQISRRIVFLEPPLHTNDLHLAISKQSPNHLKILRDFNRAMKAIFLDGTYQKILVKYRMVAEE